MKQLIVTPIILFIYSTLLVSLVHAKDPEGIPEFKERLEEAMETKNLKSISQMYDWKDIHYILKDRELLIWKSRFIEDLKLGDHKTTNITWTSKEDFSKDQLQHVTRVSRGETIEERTYLPIGVKLS